MLHALGPRHFADVYQTLNALFELDERTVVGDADDAAVDARAYGVTLAGVEPRIGRELLEAERDALLLFVELQDFHLDLITDVHQVARMRQAAPGHIGDMQQAVDAAEV